MQPQLIDRIYECAFVPELWPGALDGLAAMADARGAAETLVGLVTPGWSRDRE